MKKCIIQFSYQNTRSAGRRSKVKEEVMGVKSLILWMKQELKVDGNYVKWFQGSAGNIDAPVIEGSWEEKQRG